MNAITRNVCEIHGTDRQALERLLGRPLIDDQQVVIEVREKPDARVKPPAAQQGSTLPEWCNVYEGLSDSEIADIELAITRSSESRNFG